MYDVLLHPDAQKVYINADKALAKKIARCLQQLEQTPRSHPNLTPKIKSDRPLLKNRDRPSCRLTERTSHLDILGLASVHCRISHTHVKT
ncbi:type II toxin-antitoxin system RelE family toxin [Egbenema bharatensis]|uniref:type II toxin-antitoxin system RelE family toxin n=1 Tax=Egbenema bharatensis TaxID=3463334 RepID=UPI003A88C367